MQVWQRGTRWAVVCVSPRTICVCAERLNLTFGYRIPDLGSLHFLLDEPYATAPIYRCQLALIPHIVDFPSADTEFGHSLLDGHQLVFPIADHLLPGPEIGLVRFQTAYGFGLAYTVLLYAFHHLFYIMDGQQ